MHFRSVLAVISASAISSTIAAPVANADASPVPSSSSPSEDALLTAREIDAAQEAHRADLRQTAHEKFAKQFCYPGYPFYCYSSTTTKNYNYVSNPSNHGYGIRVHDGTTTLNFGNTQLGFHPDGTIFYKDTLGRNCDVTHTGGPKGDGCAQYLYLTNGGGAIYPGKTNQCWYYGINC
ncbi:hypothetical protein AC579_438 [Pseudocercospora musae]|uniref:Uncharacterized protein n=1 Tax=Pseudocercospora musae TaxID=113226 RepID=A0A139I612_9PEZI|nr:hypothetical protein AC579_438 [Pseudocercospora musae]KXT10204.1 hypothetical protein AC579_438 [Pseudocercospora musae]